MQLSSLLRYKWYGVSLLGLIGCLILVWYVPSVHAQVADVYHAALGVSGDSASSDPQSSQKASAGTNELKQIHDRVGLLEEQVVKQATDLKQTQESTRSLQDQLRTALTQVGQSNALLEKQQAQWIEQLKKTQVSGSAPLSFTSPPDPLPPVPPSEANPVTKKSTSKKAALTIGSKIHLNSASAAELITLPGIGPSYASRIIAYREKNGGFKTLQELRKVKGIGPKLFKAIQDYIEL